MYSIEFKTPFSLVNMSITSIVTVTSRCILRVPNLTCF